MTRGPWHEEVDLIVVGGSVGGLAAAVTAADRGCRTILVERGKELGGGAANEGETIAAAGTRFQQAAGIVDAPERLVEDIVAASQGQAERDVVSAIVAQGVAIVAWLADRCGAPVSLLAEHVARGHAVARLHSPGERGGASLVAELARAAGRHARVSVRTGVPAERIVRDESGAVRGIAVRGDRRGAVQAYAGRVLLASGGFAADDALVAEHCPAAAGLPYAGGAGATGDTLRLARDTGAATRALGSCLVTPFLATPSQLVVTAPLLQLGAVLVNQTGRRFASEATGSADLATTVRAQPGHLAYLLFDERIAAAARAADPFFAHVVLPRTGRRGATLEDLAKQLELDVEGLRATVEALERSTPPPAPPWHAIRVTGARWRTLGGLAVDATARVLAPDGTPIPNLYATGGAAAALAGEPDGVLPGTAALTTLARARLAALDVAAQVARSTEES
jgi:fumarate reductase flavoprotein subunit